MSGVATAVIGSTLVGGYLSGKGAKDAANIQAEASDRAAELQNEQFKIINEQQAPYRNAGYQTLDTLALGLKPGGQFMQKFDANSLNDYLAPNYEFMREQGLGATRNLANATGGLVGGNALRGLTTFAEDYAKNAYQDAFNNYNTNQTNIFNRLAAVAGLGQTANQSTANAGMQSAQSIADIMTGGANATAAGIMGQSNAYANMANNIGQAAYLKALGKK